MRVLWLLCSLLWLSAAITTDADTDSEIDVPDGHKMDPTNYTCQHKLAWEIECEINGVVITYENKADEVVCLSFSVL